MVTKANSALTSTRRVNSFSICECLDNVIKYSDKSIVFYNDKLVYKQYPLNQLNWINELFIVNYLNNLPAAQYTQKNIIKFLKCEIIDDFVIDPHKKEISLDRKEKVLRITMKKYDTTLDKIRNFTDGEIFLILHKLTSAMIYCVSREILHRDIKEKNIFVNYTEVGNSRKITEVVLADFNISSINYYAHTIKNSEINTISHRSPEICQSINLSTTIKYGEKTDVWSMCVVLSFLITNHSFYGFLVDGYIHINRDFMCNVEHVIIAMEHFLKIFANKKLKHIKLYKKIIFMGIQHYRTRCDFQTIFDNLREYNKNEGKYKLGFVKILRISSPTITNSKALVKNTKYIRLLHGELQTHDSVLMLFYKAVLKSMTYIMEKKLESKVFLFSMYILALFISDDNHENLDYYINIFNKMNDSRTLLENSDTQTTHKKISSSHVYSEIRKILRIQSFNILQ